MIIDTEIFNNKTIKPIGQYTNTEAYLYLLSISDFNGVLDVSVKHVSQTLVWSKSKVYRFIDKLVEDGFLTKLCNKSDTKVKDLKYCIKGNCGFLRNNMTKNRNEIGMDFKDEIENESSVKKKEPIKEAPKKAPKSPKKESTALYSKMMALYSDWFKDRNNGLPPNINVVEGVSLKKIIAYFEPLVYNKAQLNGVILEKGSEQADNEVINAFKLIFNQWETMDEFLKNGVKLSQINSNLSNIINQLRNKNGKLTKQEQREQIIERDRQEWINIANKLNNLQ